MKILDMPCTKGFMQIAQDGVDKGWHEMNGGNLSYRLTKDEAANVKNHEVKLELTGGEHRVIYHAHPVNLIALTFVLPPTDKAFTRALWEIMTECPVIFPEGVGVVPWMVPGKGPIAAATSKLMREYNIVVWVHHGLFVSGRDFDRCFGLMDTVEKAAEIRIRAQSTGAMKKSAIQVKQLKQIAHDFGFTLNKKFL